MCEFDNPQFKLVSPTHKRTEGLAPVWGSEFTSKDAALQGDLAEIAATLNIQLCVLVTGDWWWYLTAISPNLLSTRKLKADEKRAVSRVIRGCWFVLLYFAPCARCPARVAPHTNG